ncbi:MAG: protein phosphatase 2C domain-containing protein [Planctomycetaceae bacterium]|nr:protein phosphatase 2C domain-containing protein [Planctomycetales bacterium]MCB9920875.1 protein phosphatase 2C domain-containing protein [Planctomycetaceae bacterium]
MADRESNWPVDLAHVALTDVGMRRANNQDSHTVVLASDPQEWRVRGHFFMVADGMGAHAAGELASKIAVDGVPHLYRKYRELSPPEAMQKAIVETNSEVYRRGQANSDFRAMGTTASAMALLPQGALIGHIGDSRVYRVRGTKLHQLTRDHSLVWELREAGQLEGDSELANSVPKNVITRSLGPNAHVKVDIEGPYKVAVGDTFLLCSDGLMARVTDEEIAATLRNLATQEAAQLLVDLANLRGGPDNITVIVARVTGSELASLESDAAPIKIGTVKHDPKSELAFLVAIAVFFLAALLLSVIGNMPASLGALVIGLTVGLVGFLIRKRNEAKGIELGTGRKLGKGPYTSADCPESSEFAASLAKITAELRRAPAAGKYEIDWTEFDLLCQNAEGATAESRHEDAIRESARAVSLLMENIRQAMNKEASDSAIEL